MKKKNFCMCSKKPEYCSISMHGLFAMNHILHN